MNYQKVHAARALSSPYGEAAEDNIAHVQREKFWGGQNYVTDNGNGNGNGWTDRRGS